jgi:pimeloyl-ACP methyl ester carboxylesterase
MQQSEPVPVAEAGIFIPASRGQLFAVEHRPADARTGVVFLGACAEEKLWAHRAYFSFARELASAGHLVLRVDPRGEGESDLEFEESTLGSRVEDALAAIAHVRSHSPELERVFVVGHRLGGIVAATAAAALDEPPAGLVLWDPLFDGQAYLLQVLRQHLSAQLAAFGRVTVTRNELLRRMLEGELIPIEGYGFNADFCRELCATRWSEEPRTFRQPTLLIELASNSEAEASAPAIALAAAHPQVKLRTLNEQPFWRETRAYLQSAPNLSAATLAFIAEQCR